MVEAVGKTGIGSAIETARAAQVSVSSVTAQSDTTVAAKVQPLSPSTRTDPMTGVVITEYYSSDGQLEQQIPSEAVVAYLRSGLTTEGQVSADGLAAQSSDASGSDVVA
jgi:hypothetical protein